jgi:hypothetical protein
VERVREVRALLGEGVDVGRLQVGVPRHSQLIPPEIVHDDHDDVGALLSGHRVDLFTAGAGSPRRGAGEEGHQQGGDLQETEHWASRLLS